MPSIAIERPSSAQPDAKLSCSGPAARRKTGRATKAPAVAPGILVTPAALSLPEIALLHDRGGRIVVAGDAPVAMSLAELALPSATRLWVNLRQSAEISRLLLEAQAEGPIGRLILAPCGDGAADTLAIMRVVLAFLPALRAQGHGEITLIPSDPASTATLTSFAEGLRPGLADSRIVLTVSAPA
ncbi:hypothetical protein [Neotabrizicola sp. sgz301269]|uniref:hypothetical protein n=1 Tax=Neotabrizicola sp. sgz301269 TaxID=3276282 RepID=UPI0037705FDB